MGAAVTTGKAKACELIASHDVPTQSSCMHSRIGAMSVGGVLIAGTGSSVGKTTIALGIMRALSDRGLPLQPAKCGPDYIDPTYHALAANREAINLDPWAMRRETMEALTTDAEYLVVEGAMGLFDGAADGTGTGADLAVLLNLSVILVLDCSRVGASTAATLRGFASHRGDVRIAGVILNFLGSLRHREIIERAIAPVCEEFGVAVLGALLRNDYPRLPSRHLGLVPAREVAHAATSVARIARELDDCCEIGAIAELAARTTSADAPAPTIPPPGQRIAIASDAAFCFSYAHLTMGWRKAGAELLPFSPLKDDTPAKDVDAVFLPGGYPELHAGTLACANRFRTGLRDAAERGVTIYGECGGYMVLGKTLTDATGETYPMLGLLPTRTDFSKRSLHLGYRRVRGTDAAATFLRGATFKGHEFHHTTIVDEGEGDALFDVMDATGTELAQAGRSVGSVSGSFVHLIDAV